MLDDYSALAIICMLQLLKVVLLQLLCALITRHADMITQQSYILVASLPANIGACMGWGRWESWVMRHEQSEAM